MPVNFTLPKRARRVLRSLRQSFPSRTLAGRLSPGDGPAEFVDLDEILTAQLNELFPGANQGSVIFKGASAWEFLGPGSDNQVLTSGGAGADVAWEDAQGGILDLIGSGTGTGASQNITLSVSGLLPDQVAVFVNGIHFLSTEYTISGTTLTLTTNASGDSIEVYAIVPSSGGGGGGGSGSELDFGPPLITNFPNAFTAAGVTATPADVSGKGLHILHQDASGGNRAALITKLVPTAPWTITARVLRTPDAAMSGTNEYRVGLVAYNSGTGAFLTVYIGRANYHFQKWSALVLGTATTYGSPARAGAEVGPAVWLRMADDGAGNLSGQFSNDGVGFFNIGPVQSIAAQLGTITHIGFFTSIGQVGNMSALIPYYNEA